MSRRCGTWLLHCKTCNKPYKITNFMYRWYRDEEGKRFKSDTHQLKHIKEAGRTVEIVKC